MISMISVKKTESATKTTMKASERRALGLRRERGGGLARARRRGRLARETFELRTRFEHAANDARGRGRGGVVIGEARGVLAAREALDMKSRALTHRLANAVALNAAAIETEKRGAT